MLIMQGFSEDGTGSHRPWWRCGSATPPKILACGAIADKAMAFLFVLMLPFSYTFGFFHLP